MSEEFPPQGHAIRTTLPDRRRHFPRKYKVGGQTLHMARGEYDGGRLGEIWLDCHKQGTSLRNFMNAFAISLSIGLQHGVPLSVYVDGLKGLDFPPQGEVKGSDNVSEARSVIDFIVRELESIYLSKGRTDEEPH